MLLMVGVGFLSLVLPFLLKLAEKRREKAA
jgi:hypothetical protein